MFSIIKNRAALEEILNSEDYANKKQHIYTAGHLAKFEWLDKNGNKDQHTADMHCFIVSDSEHNDETICSEFFNMINQDVHKAKNYIKIKADAVHKTIEIHSSATATTLYYGFWGSPELKKDDIKTFLDNLSS